MVYDGPTSHALAFGSALGSAEALADLLVRSAPTGLACAATDLETFGHHHRFSERAVGHLLFELSGSRGFDTGGLARLVHGLATHDVGAVIPSAWSCAHGYERWRSDCGCSTDGTATSHQRWRAPLRHLLEVLREHAHEVFGRRGADVFFDPWAARDAYGEVLADRSQWSRFVDEQVRPVASQDEAAALLASQEATLASFTSCAWFFADLPRPEVAIVLQEAARSLELLGLLGEPAPLERALRCLDVPGALDGPAASAGLCSGRDVWEWATRERSDSGTTDAGLRRWDTMTPVVALVTRLATDAVSGSAEAAHQAVHVIELAQRAGDAHLYVVAQHQVYDALLGAGRAAPEHLCRLGSALNLAVDTVTGAPLR